MTGATFTVPPYLTLIEIYSGDRLMDIIIFVLIQIAVNIIQAITGFGGPPIAMPPSMALVGVNEAKAAVTFLTWFASIFVTIRNFKDVDWKKLWIMLGVMVPGAALGMWMFSNLSLTYLMLGYGITVVLIGLKRLLITQKGPLPKPLRISALVLSGLMQGMFTSGGPFLALYSTEAIKDKRVFRATVSSVWSILNTYMIITMFIQKMYTPKTLELIGWSVIPVVAAVFVGNRVNLKMKQSTFMKLVYLLLIISGSLLIFNFITK